MVICIWRLKCFTPLVSEMMQTARSSMDSLRNEIQNVQPGPVIDDVEFIDFEFRGGAYRLPLQDGDNWVVFGDNRESDKSVALRLLLRSGCK